ncbi:MAG TPA: DoxX family protein [Candidatus Dormibacteraeota bacterium]|nr:DoxX family protein [Candidatus Dormibacteraeota bacterium]
MNDESKHSDKIRMVHCTGTAYGAVTRISNYLQSPLLLAIRLYWGWQFFQTGWGKLGNIPHVTEFFTSLHIPFPGANAWIVAIMECFGGLLLMVGFGSRFVAFALAFDMVIAYVTADSEALKSIFSDSDKFVQAAPFPFLLMTLTVLAFSAGVFSLDWLIGRKFYKKSGNA